MDFERPMDLRVFALQDGPAYAQIHALVELIAPETVLVPAGSDRATPLVGLLTARLGAAGGASGAVVTVPRRAFTAEVDEALVTVCCDQAAAVSHWRCAREQAHAPCREACPARDPSPPRRPSSSASSRSSRRALRRS